MNAMVAFRGNSMGHMSPSRAQRQDARQQIASMMLAKHGEATKAATAQASASKAALGTTKSDSAAPKDEMGRDMFLQLLVMEMQNQDPLEPVDNTDMIAQLAQFTSLEQMTQLNDSFEQLNSEFSLMTGNMDQLNFMTAQGLLGKYVEGVSADGELHGGQVESVHLDGSIVVLTVDGKFMPMTGVLSVSTTAPENPDPGEQE